MVPYQQQRTKNKKKRDNNVSSLLVVMVVVLNSIMLVSLCWVCSAVFIASSVVSDVDYVLAVLLLTFMTAARRVRFAVFLATCLVVLLVVEHEDSFTAFTTNHIFQCMVVLFMVSGSCLNVCDVVDASTYAGYHNIDPCLAYCVFSFCLFKWSLCDTFGLFWFALCLVAGLFLLFPVFLVVYTLCIETMLCYFLACFHLVCWRVMVEFVWICFKSDCPTLSRLRY